MLSWLTVILSCQLAGELIVVWLGLPLPGPVAGMVLLFALLTMIGDVPAELARIGSGLLSNLSLLFVPAGVGIMTHVVLLRQDWPALGAGVVFSTLLTIVVTAWVMIAAKRLFGVSDHGKDEERVEKT